MFDDVSFKRPSWKTDLIVAAGTGVLTVVLYPVWSLFELVGIMPVVPDTAAGMGGWGLLIGLVMFVFLTAVRFAGYVRGRSAG